MEPGTTGTTQRSAGRWRGKPGLIGALATVVLATAVAAGISQSGENPSRAASASAIQQVVIPTPEPTPPATDPPAPPEPVTSSSSTTTVTSPPVTAPATTPPPTAARVTVPEPPVTLSGALLQAMGGLSGCLVVEDDGATVFEHGSGSAFVPASSQKLLVAAAAVSRLGADFRYETKVLATRPPEDGVLHDAWLVGGGDPFLATPEYISYVATKKRTAALPLTPMTALADELVGLGIRSIPGGLHTDESRYEPQRSVPTWKPSYVTEAEVGSLGALTVNEGLQSWGANQKVAADPAMSTATALGKLLSDRGVSLAQPSPGGKAPAEAVVIATIRSATASDIVAAMLAASDNYAAEMLVKEIDHKAGGPGITVSGTAQVLEENARLGVNVEGVRMNDGSGLDTGNRATCRALLGSLNLSRQARFSVLDSGLAIAGHTGTLSRRYVGSPAEFRLAAKTGWINGAAAMVGRIATQPVRRFALLFNGSFGWPTAQATQDRIVSLLTSNLTG
jgi:D-alanyl-D-alanine carboxypeptidase/D-alanyl-D-alanine-endopeptidase (penicillin-binding protein 4)